MGETLLQGEKVTRKFGGLVAVNEVSFEVCRGEIVGLLGPNGSGKTTLFNCISGVDHADSGEVTFKGRRITRLKPYRISWAGLARTFQMLRIYDNLTVYENMLLARQWRGVPIWRLLGGPELKARAKADELLEFLLLERVRNNLAKNISLGQQRLLEIGMALMPEPEIVLLDEATSGVNPALIDDIMAAIRRLNSEKGVAFFIIEHNMHFAMALCSRLYVLDSGRLLAEGTPDEIQHNAAVVEAYFGHDSANVSCSAQEGQA